MLLNVGGCTLVCFRVDRWRVRLCFWVKIFRWFLPFCLWGWVSWTSSKVAVYIVWLDYRIENTISKVNKFMDYFTLFSITIIALLFYTLLIWLRAFSSCCWVLSLWSYSLVVIVIILISIGLAYYIFEMNSEQSSFREIYEFPNADRK